MATNIPYIEKIVSFRRAFAGPLDSQMVMTSAEKLTYLNNSGTKYHGQLVFDTDHNTLFSLSSDGNNNYAWVAVGSNVTNTAASTDYSTLYNRITALELSADNLYTDGLSSLADALSSSLSGLDSIGELASAVSALELQAGTGSGGAFLTKVDPKITSGNLELAYAGGIKLSADGLPSSVFVVTSARQIIGSEFYAGSGTDAQVKVTPAGLYASSTYYVGSGGDSNLGALTASSFKIADNKFSIDASGNVTVGVIGGQEANLTVTGNLSVLGEVTYLDTKVETLSTTLVSLSSDSETGLKVTQTGAYNVVTFVNGDGKGLNIDKDGKLSASTDAKFLSAVDITGKLTVTEDISSTKTVAGSAGKFTNLLEVGPETTSVLYVNASGVGIDTETLSGYSLAIDSAGANKGTLYVAGSAAFGSYATLDSTGGEVATSGSGSTKTISLTGNKRAVNWETMWTYISALDGGTF